MNCRVIENESVSDVHTVRTNYYHDVSMFRVRTVLPLVLHAAHITPSMLPRVAVPMYSAVTSAGLLTHVVRSRISPSPLPSGCIRRAVTGLRAATTALL